MHLLTDVIFGTTLSQVLVPVSSCCIRLYQRG